MDYPVVDDQGELVETRTASSVSALLAAVPQGRHVLIVEVPTHPVWWSFDSMAWVDKPAQPSRHHEWDAVGKSWRDPRTPEQIAADRIAAVRRVRDVELAASDIEALRALDVLLPEELRARRQALRDIPAAADPVAALAALTGVQIEPA